jgi:mannitol/fructose-specific phosphotransferase system IIA component (Ntr-type)
MKLNDFVIQDALVPSLSATERDDVVAELIDALVAAGATPAELRDELIKEIVKREKNGSTGFGKGVAVPHVKHEKLPKMAAAIGISEPGVDFNALDKAPVHTVVLLLSPTDKPDEHLQAMENIFSNLQKDQFRRFLRQAGSREAILDVLQDADAQRLG